MPDLMGIDQCSHCPKKHLILNPTILAWEIKLVTTLLETGCFENLQWKFQIYNSNQLTAGKNQPDRCPSTHNDHVRPLQPHPSETTTSARP